MNWEHKDEWRRSGKNFMVVVSRHESSETFDRGIHRWCVYAYIYPHHTHFKNFDGDDMFQDAATVLPLHWGPSLLKRHTGHGGDITSIQVGADYNHLHDNHFTFCGDKDSASTVFADADSLFDFLENMGDV